MKIIGIIFGLFLSMSLCIFAYASDAPLKLDVYQADENSFHVSSVLVTGVTEAALIDAQFTRADAHQVVAKILRSGKKLTTIYVSHGDPDYYFGLEVIQQAFPKAKVYATQETLNHINATLQKKLDFWGPKLGTNGPKDVVIPEVLKGDSFTVDGQEIKIVGLEKHAKRTFVWIPSIKSVVGGVPVYANVHLWMADAATTEKRQLWFEILDEITALKPEVVVPGHATKNTSKTLEAVEFSRGYLKDYEQELEVADNSKALIDAMSKKYPNASLAIALEIGAKVSKGEMKW